MALIVETGEGLEDAEAYASVATARAFAGSFGLTLPDDNAEVEVLLRKATVYVDSQEGRFQGSRTNETQALAFPRCGVRVNSFSIADDALPRALVSACCQYAIDFQTNNPFVVGEGRQVIQETVGPLTTIFSASGAATARPEYLLADSYLQPLLKSAGSVLFCRV